MKNIETEEVIKIDCSNCIHFGSDYDLEEYAGTTVRREYSICKDNIGTHLGESWYSDEKGCKGYED